MKIAIMDPQKEVNQGKLKTVKKVSSFGNSRGIAVQDT